MMGHGNLIQIALQRHARTIAQGMEAAGFESGSDSNVGNARFID